MQRKRCGQTVTILLLLLIAISLAEANVSIDEANASLRLALNSSSVAAKEGAEDMDQIVGGSAVPAGSYNFAAQIYAYSEESRSWYYTCSASLITSSHVLTAAHCVFLDPTSPFSRKHPYMYVSMRDPSTNALQVVTGAIPQSNIIAHPYYSFGPNFYNDIAVIKLGTTITTRSPVYLNSWGTNVDINPTVAMGWGQTSSSSSTSPILLSAGLTLQSAAYCQYQSPNYDDATQLCTYDGNQRQTCDGDSGGPLITTAFQGWQIQIGITSGSLKGEGCDGGAVYTRVSAYYGWIVDAVKK